MKVQELKRIIREEVKAAVKEELQDMLNEAVKVASTPSTPSTPVKQPAPKKVSYGTGGLEDLLEDTRSSMSSDDYRNVVSMDSSMVTKPNFASMMASQTGMVGEQPSFTGNEPGLDLSQLDFVTKAKSILDMSYQKDKNRGGI